VNQRHSESTPAGSSYHRADPEMGDLPHRVQPDPDGRYTVDVHVTPDGHARIGNQRYTPEEFADILRRNGDYDGRPIRLIGCDAGSNDFAKRLSRELDTEVMAPNKPAWTDSNGRVFSSDYEVGPDGKMRPRIPPNGEWDVHSPDGSTHRASDDGFTPDTHHADKHDVDPDDAAARGPRRIDPNPVEIETRTPPATMDEKLNNDDYRKKYYDGPDKNGEYQRKNEHQQDHNKDQVPVLKHDPDKPDGEEFYSKPTDYVPMKYREDIPPVEHPATPTQKSDAQQLIDDRARANERAGVAEQQYQDAKKDGTLTDELSEERRAAHQERTDLGEELGERAATDAVHDKYPPEKFDLKPLPDPPDPDAALKPGAGRFDQIYEVHNKETGQTSIVLDEAKGPNADLGTRAGDGGQYEQGHPRYVDSVVENMRMHGTPAERKLAGEIQAAKYHTLAADPKPPGAQLEYLVAKARVHSEGAVDVDGNRVDIPGSDPPKQQKRPIYGGYNLKQFDLSI
jgi:hypothetical protein